MSIRSLFTSHERLLAEWMMNHEFNREIVAEHRFPGENQDIVRQSYKTSMYEPSPSVMPTEDEKKRIRETRLTWLKIPLEDEADVTRKMEACRARQLEGKKEAGRKRREEHELNESFEELRKLLEDVELNDLLTGKGLEAVRKACKAGELDKPFADEGSVRKGSVYKMLLAPEICSVERKSSVENVEYVGFWGRTHFASTVKKTGYFLVDGWLVVSVPKEEKDNPYEINDDVDLNVAVKWDEGPDPIANNIALYKISWVALEAVKLMIVFTASLVGAGLFVATSATLGKTGHWSDQFLSRVFLIGSIAMQAMVFYSAYKLYRLFYFTNKIDSINNLGSWVWHIRQSAEDCPDLAINAFDNISKFFTKIEQVTIDFYVR